MLNTSSEKRRGEQVAIEDHFFPDAAGDHDGVERQRLDHHRDGGGLQTFARIDVAHHKAHTDEEH